MLAELTSLVDGAVSKPSEATKAQGDPSVTAPAAPASDWLGSKITQIVMILLGLLLIAAGIFSFDKTREVIVSGAKAAAAA